MFDLARAEGKQFTEVQAQATAGHKKMEAWLHIIRKAEEIASTNPPGCHKCGRASCEDSVKCEDRAKRIGRVRKTVPLDEALRARTTAPVWLLLIREHRDDLTIVYEMFKNSTNRRQAA